MVASRCITGDRDYTTRRPVFAHSSEHVNFTPHHPPFTPFTPASLHSATPRYIALFHATFWVLALSVASTPIQARDNIDSVTADHPNAPQLRCIGELRSIRRCLDNVLDQAAGELAREYKIGAFLCLYAFSLIDVLQREDILLRPRIPSAVSYLCCPASLHLTPLVSLDVVSVPILYLLDQR